MSYNTADIRQFMSDRFSDQEITDLSFDYFRNVYDDYAAGMTKGQKIHCLIEHCERREVMPHLLAALAKTRPEQYQRKFAPVAKVQAEPAKAVRDPKQVFISHAHQDAEFAHRLAGDLKQCGWRIWIAPESIRPGEKWVEAIGRGLDSSGVFVLIMTPAAVASMWVRSETGIAIELQHEGHLQFVPLDVQGCNVPTMWRAYQRVPFRGRYEDGVAALLRALGVEGKARVAAPSTPQRLPFEPEMMLVPAGEFLMGSDPGKDKDIQSDEKPQHTLYLPDYYLAKTPVTNAQYLAFVQAAGYKQPRHWKYRKLPSGKENHPVVYVSWYDAMAYCSWLAEATGKPYSLPSEAEWEKAASWEAPPSFPPACGGMKGGCKRIYPWGDQWDAKRCNTDEGGKGDTTPVGAYPQGASPFGLQDCAGNVWEWTRSILKPYPYDPKDGREDLEAKGSRVLRGSAFDRSAVDARCAFRLYWHPDPLYGNLGFRVLVFPISNVSGL